MLLYGNYCHYCRTRSVHFRRHSRVRSIQELRSQITRWQAVLGLGWSAAEIGDVLAYLNGLYYRLPDAVMAPGP